VVNQTLTSLGFTLVELVLSMAVISIAALGISSSLSFALQHQSDGLWQAKAIALSRSYFEEIAAKRYDETTPNGGVPPCSIGTTSCSAAANFDDGEARAAFDDIDDYAGLDESPPLDPAGSARLGYTNYRVQIDVRYATAAEQATLGLDAVTDLKVIDLTVTTPGGASLDFALVRGNY